MYVQAYGEVSPDDKCDMDSKPHRGIILVGESSPTTNGIKVGGRKLQLPTVVLADANPLATC